MDITLADQRIVRLGDRLTSDEIRQRAMDRRATAFAGGLGGLLGRPRPEDVVLVESQRRLEPVWHVAGRARYVYDRARTYSVPASAPEVRAVTVGGEERPVAPGKTGPAFTVDAVEHCREETVRELWLDGRTGAALADAALLAGAPAQDVADPASLAADGALVLAPERRASAVVRQLIAELMRPVQADRIEEEAIALETTDLLYRPVWAFEFHWQPKDRRGVVEIDGLSGQVRQGQSLVASLTQAVTRDALFDIGADTVGLLVPGGSIAVKVARAALDKTY